MEILSFYVKAQTLKRFLEKALGWFLRGYMVLICTVLFTACFEVIFNLFGMKLSLITSSLLYVLGEAFFIQALFLKK